MRDNSKSAMLRMPSFWNQGIVYCTCGHLLKESEASQHFHQWRWDASSIENYVIKKERPGGARHVKTEAQKEHFIAHHARRRCLKKKFEGIHDRFLKDSTYRDSQLKKLAGLKKRALRCTNKHRKTTPVVHCLKSSTDIGRFGI